MLINNQPYRTIWLKSSTCIQIIDQRNLPHELVIENLTNLDEFARAIREMHVRGAPLIGSTAAYGMYIAALNANAESIDNQLLDAKKILDATRPTAVNLMYATDRVLRATQTVSGKVEKVKIALQTAHDITEESVAHCRAIGEYGLEVIKKVAAQKPNEPVNILTHCNAGWMACIDYGTATAPIYAAHAAGIPVHVWVDETRPRNQGARITAFELQQQGVPHTVIPDNVGGHLMQHGMVDLCIVGSDRTTRCGDVANKIGTYLKALAAKDNNVPFYVALPSSTFDFTLRDGIKEIPIETRGSEEVKYMQGLTEEGTLTKVLITPAESPALNYGFDVTPAHLVTGLITERGICQASEAAISEMFEER
ncbi:MAG: S-methyl-5-thioribose-1-phosphate isomerase [Saprospiraceae bacterium]